ncbi:MAG: alkyl sulfatase C-terminal domain-containing protein, partial [Microthrixaceae bacterium]
ASELRNGTPSLPGVRGAVSLDVMAAMTPEMVLDNCAVKLNGPLASEHAVEFTIEFTDRAESFQVFIGNGTLRHRRLSGANDTPNLLPIIRTTVQTFIKLSSELATVEEAIALEQFTVDGQREPFEIFVSLLDQFDLFFPIIEP